MADNLPEPKSRKESYLAKAAGMSVTIPEEPESREEQYLAAIAEGGGGATYTAGANIQISDENVISATDTTYSNFVGTDGADAGTAGLVPAPAVADANKFLKSDGTWSTAGGGGPTVVQTTGTSTTDVMSQNAVTGMVYTDPETRQKIQVGANATASGMRAIAIGNFAQATAKGSIALGDYSISSVAGVMHIGQTMSNGYNNSNYRLLTGLYDPQTAHDAATKGYVDSLVGNVASALNAINNGTGA